MPAGHGAERRPRGRGTFHVAPLYHVARRGKASTDVPRHSPRYRHRSQARHRPCGYGRARSRPRQVPAKCRLAVHKRDFGDADGRCDLAGKRQRHALSGSAGGQVVEEWLDQKEIGGKRVAWLARQCHDGNSTAPCDRRRLARLKCKAMGNQGAGMCQCLCRAIRAPGTGASHQNNQVATGMGKRSRDRLGIAGSCLDRDARACFLCKRGDKLGSQFGFIRRGEIDEAEHWRADQDCTGTYRPQG